MSGLVYLPLLMFLLYQDMDLGPAPLYMIAQWGKTVSTDELPETMPTQGWQAITFLKGTVNHINISHWIQFHCISKSVTLSKTPRQPAAICQKKQSLSNCSENVLILRFHENIVSWAYWKGHMQCRDPETKTYLASGWICLCPQQSPLPPWVLKAVENTEQWPRIWGSTAFLLTQVWHKWLEARSLHNRTPVNSQKTQLLSKALVYLTDWSESIAQSCLTLCESMDCTPPGSSVHGISQEVYWSELPFPSPEDLPIPGIKPGSPALQADFFTTSATREAWYYT